MDVKMQSIHFSLIVLAATISSVLSYEICTYYIDFTYKYCDDGYHCCENNTQCCSDVYLTIGAIIGIVIGSIFFLSCCICVICVVVKKNHHPGQIIQPAQQPGVAVVTTGQHLGQPMYGQPIYGQPSYGQPQYGQPPFGHPQQVDQQRQGTEKAGSSDPAYPPPPPPAY